MLRRPGAAPVGPATRQPQREMTREEMEQLVQQAAYQEYLAQAQANAAAQASS